jgi:DNA-binding transcriptional ArsR family regulator
VLGFAGALLALLSIRQEREPLALAGSSLSALGIIATVGCSMFPYILPYSIDAHSSLTVWNASSTHKTLGIMLFVTAVFPPIVLAYTAWAYKVMFGRVVLTDAELCVFPCGPFERVLENHARMERLLLQRTLQAPSDARGRMLGLARRSAEEKVASFLLDMAARTGSTGCRAPADEPVTFDLPLARGQIADVLGLTIETVSRQMTKLKAAGVIRLPGGRAITISDSAALQQRAEVA